MNKHDEHYKDQGNYEPIKIIEHFLKATDLPPLVAYHLTHVLRYILRAGSKDGQPWAKDLEKALNYMYRAVNGSWMDEPKANKETEKFIKEEFTNPKRF